MPTARQISLYSTVYLPTSSRLSISRRNNLVCVLIPKVIGMFLNVKSQNWLFRFAKIIKRR